MLYLDDVAAGITLDPAVLRAGDYINAAFRAARVAGATTLPRYDVAVFDAIRRRVATLLRGCARAGCSTAQLCW